jgi:hypothetical protein
MSDDRERRTVAWFAHELVKRVARAGKAERFTLFEVCPQDATAFLVALEKLVAAGYAERVVEGCGKWFYRLTESGKAAARKRTPPKLPGTWS